MLLAIRYNIRTFPATKMTMNENKNPVKAEILDGLEVSTAVLTSVHDAIETHVQAGGRRPGLAVVLVGEDPASSTATY